MADYLDSSGPIDSIIELIRVLVVIYILTKFGDDWLIFVDARVLTSKLWTDVGRTDRHRQTVSDHNSSLSTPCSCELKSKQELQFLRTKSVTKKEMNKCMAEIYDPGILEPGLPGL